MKKVNFKNVLMALVLALTFVVMGVQETNAQAVNELSNGIYSTPVGAFVSKDVAEERIEDKIQSLKNQGANAGPTVLAAIQKEYLYFQGIHDALDTGVSVPEAISSALQLMGSDVHSIGKSLLGTFRSEAITLLSD